MPFSNPIVKKSPMFAAQLKRVLKTPELEQYYLKELAKLARQHLASEVHKRRRAKHLSQAQLAQKIGTTQAVISRIEQSKVDVGFSLLVKLKCVLNISLAL